MDPRTTPTRSAAPQTECEQTGTGSEVLRRACPHFLADIASAHTEEAGTGAEGRRHASPHFLADDAPARTEETGTGSEVRRRACPHFLRWPWRWVVREELRSTSDYARTLVAADDAPLPLVVWTRKQTQGRGRGAHSWWSDEGSLTFTLALEPQRHSLRPEHTACVALASAVALLDVLEPLVPGTPLGIRWPNDLEAAGRKLGGILPELVATAHGQRLLIGIGLNVQTNLDEAPDAVRAMATSLAALRKPGAEPLTPESLLPRVLDRLAGSLEALSAGDPALADRWRQLDALAGQSVRIDLGGKILAGVACGIDDRGGLRVLPETHREPITLYGGQVLRNL